MLKSNHKIVAHVPLNNQLRHQSVCAIAAGEFTYTLRIETYVFFGDGLKRIRQPHRQTEIRYFE